MPNIYLRVSKYVAAFMRATGDGQSLLPSTPIQLSPYTQEYVVLINGLRIIPEGKQRLASCYSQSAWQNMSRGIMPQGGSPIIKRDPNQWLSFSEICTLEKMADNTKVLSYDFLCISIPREVCRGDKLVHTNKMYTLDTSAANQLRKLLRISFIRCYAEFEEKSHVFASAQGINRTNVEILERFLAEYDIPVSHDQKESTTFRNLASRWRREAKNYASDPSIIKNPLITRIDPHERQHGRHLYKD